MEVLAEVWLAWNQQIGTTIATILALVALLKGTGKDPQMH